MLANIWRGGQSCAGADHGHRQVVVDVGVLARERELDRFDPRDGAPLHQWPRVSYRPAAKWAALANLLFEPAHFIMGRRQLLARYPPAS